ncbi:MAG: hypothetical protein ACQEWL_06745 [Pseudomonadota bacterium]
MNWNLGVLECGYCHEKFNCSIGLSNKTSTQSFSFCCPKCSGLFEIKLTPFQNEKYYLSNNLIRTVEKDFFDIPSFKLHLDFPAIYTKGWIPFSPFSYSTLLMKEQREIEHYKIITQKLNSYTDNILDLKSFFNLHKKGKFQELYKLAESIIGSEHGCFNHDDYISIYKLTAPEYVSRRDFDMYFYKLIFIIMTPLNNGENPNVIMKKYSDYIVSLNNDKVKELFNYLNNANYFDDITVTTNRVYNSILSSEEIFRPSIFIMDYTDIDIVKEKSPLKISHDGIDGIINIYKDICEVISRFYTLIAGLNNIKHNMSYDSFKIKKIKMYDKYIYCNNLLGFSGLDLGLKSRFINDSYFSEDVKVISTHIRNSIAHNNWSYNDVSQVITFKKNKKLEINPENAKSLNLTSLEFCRNIMILFRVMHKLNILTYLVIYEGESKDKMKFYDY